MVILRKESSRRLVVASGVALVLASQLASGMPTTPQQHALLEVFQDDLNWKASSPSFANRRRAEEVLEEVKWKENVHPLNRRQQRVVTVVAPASSSANVAVVTVTAPAASAAAASSSAVSSAAPATRTASSAASSSRASSSAAAASSSTAPATTSAASSSSATLPAVTPVSTNGGRKMQKATSTSGSSPTSTPTSNSIFSVHNKLFPAGVAAIIGIVFGSMIIIIAIIRCVLRSKMTPQEKAGEYGDYSKKRNGGIALRSAHTLRRAFTRGKLGSFARRNQQGSVLIDVGDEVYAVTPEVAREYERERSMMGGSSGGSRLTSSGFGPGSARQALKNAQMTVAANQAGSDQMPSWQARSADMEYSGSDDSLGHRDLSRGISQRVTDGLRTLRGSASNETLVDDEKDDEKNMAYSFDSAAQQQHNHHGDIRQAEVPANAYLPVITRGAREWDIRPQRQPTQIEHVAKQSKGTQSPVDRSAPLSHERRTLTDSPVRPAQDASSRNERRPKSILVRRDEHGNLMKRDENGNLLTRQRTMVAAGGPPRNSRISSSTSPASPKVLQRRNTSHPDDAPPLYMRPSMPMASQPGGTPNSQGANTRDLVRPLPMPPSYS